MTTLVSYRRALAIAAAAAIVVVALSLWFTRPPARGVVITQEAAPADPRVVYQGPYRSVRPDIAYVGDDACTQCHLDIAQSFKASAMGRSIRPMAEAAPELRYDRAAHNPFEFLGNTFSVERRDGRIWHVQSRADAQGGRLLDFRLEAHYAIGSGTRGASFLTDRDGYLFETAISWFTQKQVWDSSPGFDRESLPGRAIREDCLFCHANRAIADDNKPNRYDRPFAVGHSIGCERCHGPGADHVQHGGAFVDGIDPTIVNPRRLEHALREAVCQQCHLEGAGRVVRRGRRSHEFRPGLPLESVLAVFVHADDAGEKAVSHVEQMYLSACFRQSDGPKKLGCISCHDPHRKIPAAERANYYRQGCLQCHNVHACNAPAPARAAEQDRCADCHMPRFQASDIAHTASTDHRIIRPGKAKRLAPSTDDQLKPFLPKGVPATDRDLMRDHALALLSHGNQTTASRRHDALKLLERVCGDFPDDLVALEEWGMNLLMLGRSREAQMVLAKVLNVAPHRERTLYAYAFACAGDGKDDAALDAWRRAVTANPWMPFYRGQLTELLAKRRDWSAMRPEAAAWLRLDPGNLDARKAWITALLKTGEPQEARAELARTKALNPFSQGQIQAWFDETMH